MGQLNKKRNKVLVGCLYQFCNHEYFPICIDHNNKFPNLNAQKHNYVGEKACEQTCSRYISLPKSKMNKSSSSQLGSNYRLNNMFMSFKKERKK